MVIRIKSRGNIQITVLLSKNSIDNQLFLFF